MPLTDPLALLARPDAPLPNPDRGLRRAPRAVDAKSLVAAHRIFRATAPALLPEPVSRPAARLVDPMVDLPDPRLVAAAETPDLMRDGLLPWRRVGDATVILTARAEDFRQHAARLAARFGPVLHARATPARITEALLSLRGPALNRAAEDRVAAHESCRGWDSSRLIPWALGAALILVALAVMLPQALVAMVVGWCLVTLFLSSLLKAAAALAGLRALPPQPPGPRPLHLPVVSLLVPLFGEGAMAARLVGRLAALDYPAHLLDILLIVEAADRVTRDSLGATPLPPTMRVVVVATGGVQTKPRALNIGLAHARGSIIGVYDAEDAPACDQIARVVARFFQRGPKVACLQGVLDFYNPRSNWLARCFTIEYASWFRVILPGLARLGLAIPLGGTTLFFRRTALDRIGGWDAHNVTEDADLGIRLARHGYRAEMIDSVTMEEANCRPLPWLWQRSRWLKGYMMTWAVHMRDPALLWRQLGAWRFFGFQVLFLGSLSQALLAPLLWSLWLMPLGLPHPLVDGLSSGLRTGMVVALLATDGLTITLGVMGLRRTGHRMGLLWVPTMLAYLPLGAIAAYRAAWELVRRPFHWDKTSHGHFAAA